MTFVIGGGLIRAVIGDTENVKTVVIIIKPGKRCPRQSCIVRPMKIDIMFLVPARMGFICRTKIIYYF
jgi:hypothetical protein